MQLFVGTNKLSVVPHGVLADGGCSLVQTRYNHSNLALKMELLRSKLLICKME
jgi:hypothetical protein